MMDGFRTLAEGQRFRINPTLTLPILTPGWYLRPQLGLRYIGYDLSRLPPGAPAVLHYAPRGTALDRVPNDAYTVPETFAQYEIAQGAEDDFLEILLDRIESHYGLPGFAGACTSAFEDYLQTVDADEDEPGVQPYVDPDNNPILTVADTDWFGPASPLIIRRSRWSAVRMPRQHTSTASVFLATWILGAYCS